MKSKFATTQEILPSHNVDMRVFLSQYRGREVDLLLNWGNCGDSFIQRGARYLLQDAGISVRRSFYLPESRKEHEHQRAGDVLLILGAGGFCRAAKQMVQARRYFDTYNSIVVLPSTFETDEPMVDRFIQGAPKHVVLFCRELLSFERASRVAACPENILLSCDTAFYYPFKDLTEVPAPFSSLNSFRRDSESIRSHPLTRNIDLSGLGNHNDVLPILAAARLYSMVHTDRLHVGIAFALSGRKTVLYDNSNSKVRGVYATYLKDFPHVSLEDGCPAPNMSAMDFAVGRAVLSCGMRVHNAFFNPRYFVRSVYRKLIMWPRA